MTAGSSNKNLIALAALLTGTWSFASGIGDLKWQLFALEFVLPSWLCC